MRFSNTRTLPGPGGSASLPAPSGSRTSTPGGPNDVPWLVQGIAGGESDTVLAHHTVGPVVNVRGMCTEKDPPPRPACHGGLGLLATRLPPPDRSDR
jgi:hypothetical protein